jgi:diguanylate cyclase (GGDEF)-like protein
MGRLVSWFDARSPDTVTLLALLLIVLISVVDYFTPPEISTSVFYLAPLGLAAWFAGPRSGLAMALLAAGAWTAKDIMFRGVAYAEQWILLWNTISRVIMFSLVAWLFAQVRLTLQREQRLARTDPLTGLLNTRAFYEELSLQLERARRAGQPMTFVYLDLDHFKQLNDEQGHQEGDRALVTVAEVFRRELRRTDVLGRIGGDEFAMIFPDTDAADTPVLLEKLRVSLNAETARYQWPITFSVGAITCRTPGPSPEDLVHAADKLMYEVKAGGRDAVLHRLWSEAG